MLLAIGDGIVQGLNAWNRRGLYCVRGGALQGPSSTCASCACLATKLPAFFVSQAVQRGDEIILRYKGSYQVNLVGPSLPWL